MFWSLIHFSVVVWVWCQFRSAVHCLVCGDPFVPVLLAEDGILWALHVLSRLFTSV